MGDGGVQVAAVGGSVAPLALLAAGAVSRARPLAEIAACLDVLPRAVRRELLAQLSHERLRGLEICWRQQQQQEEQHVGPEASGAEDEEEEEEDEEEEGGWSLEREMEHEWRLRSASDASPPAAEAPAGRKRSFRQAFWEQRFRLLLRARAAPSLEPGSEKSGESQEEEDPALHLFQDVVRLLKVHGREVVPRNVALVAALQRLRRLEIHHPEQQKTCWASLAALVERHPSLAELCFFHGRLGDAQLQQIRLALRARAAAAGGRLRAIAAFELVSLTLRQRGHAELVALLRECRELTAVRLSACLADFENDALVAAALALPRLATLSLEHNHLGDDAFTGPLRAGNVAEVLALRRLKLDSNAISVPTLSGICAASLDGRLRLERLELHNNVEVRDASVHALAPMLAAADSALTHLNLYGCSLGLEGATTLLLALRHNASLTHLDVSNNFLGSHFGDLLAAFLRANARLRSLRINYVGLGAAGCSEPLLAALRANRGLCELAVGANRLRDGGAERLFQAFAERSRRLGRPWASVDLSGNLVTLKGLSAMANTIERLAFEDARQAHGDPMEAARPTKRPKLVAAQHSEDAGVWWIRELNLLDNDFPRDLAANEAALRTLHTRVLAVRTNTWVGKRNVYDDEV